MQCQFTPAASKAHGPMELARPGKPKFILQDPEQRTMRNICKPDIKGGLYANKPCMAAACAEALSAALSVQSSQAYLQQLIEFLLSRMAAFGQSCAASKGRRGLVELPGGVPCFISLCVPCRDVAPGDPSCHAKQV